MNDKLGVDKQHLCSDFKIIFFGKSTGEEEQLVNKLRKRLGARLQTFT